VDRGMDQNDTGIDLAQPLPRSCAAMRRAIVHDPKQPFAGTVRFLRQHLVDQSAKGYHASRRFTPTYHVPPAHIPCGQIWQGAAALVFVFDIGRSARCGGQGGMAADAGLDAGLLVGTEDVVLGAKALALPSAGIQVQNRSGLLGEVGITRKDPVLVPPRFDGIRIQNPPHRAATDRFAQRFAGPGSDVGQGLPTQWLLGFRKQFTSARLDQRVVQGGKKPPCGPVPARLPRKNPLWSNGGASVGPNADAAAPIPRPRGWTQAGVDAQAAPTWPVAATGTERSFAGQSFQPAPRMSRETQGGSSVEAHAWETSFGDSGSSDHQTASHFSSKSSPKT